MSRRQAPGGERALESGGNEPGWIATLAQTKGGIMSSEHHRPVAGRDSSTSPQSGRREQILNAAERLFARHGYRETGLLDVATELGVRRQAVYHYFPSKQEILYELIDRAGSAVSRAADATLDSQQPPDQILAEVVRNHVRGLLARPDIFRIQFAELPKLDGARADALRSDINRYVKRVADLIHAGQEDGVFAEGPPMALALMVIGMCNFTLEWHTTDSGISDEDVAELCARTALGGVSPRSAP